MHERYVISGAKQVLLDKESSEQDNSVISLSNKNGAAGVWPLRGWGGGG